MENKINWDEWEKCTMVEYDDSTREDTASIRQGEEDHFFRRKSKTVFEDKLKRVVVRADGFHFCDKIDLNSVSYFGEEKQLILDAVDEWKKRWDKK